MRALKSISLSVLTISLCISPTFINAQGLLEEIVVTARKRDESIVDIPAAMTVFTADGIEEAGIGTPHDFINLTPNMTIIQSQNPGTTFVTIRGISQARNSEMSVAVMVDGVLLSNPAQFNQELFDIEQIEILKGPQGALYGRNAIGGAVTITTKQPSDELEGKVSVGYDSGPGYRIQGALSGPVGSSDTLKFRGSVSYKDTDGFLDNATLNTEADPYEDFSGRIKLLWQPNEQFTADARFSASLIDTTALYFVINKDLAGTLSNLGLAPIPAGSPNEDNSNFTGLPILSDNLGNGEKDMYNASLKLDYEADIGTFTSITAWDETEEILTGDQFDFRPGGPGQFDPTAPNFNNPAVTGNAFMPFSAPSLQAIIPFGLAPADGLGGAGFGPGSFGPSDFQFLSFNNASLCNFVVDFKGLDQFGLPQNVMDGFCSDWNQAQWLSVESISQEFRFTSPADNRFRYILGGYFISTDRFISTGNLVEDGTGIAEPHRTPRTTTGFPFDPSITNPQASFLADSQDNFAWAVFADVAYDLTDNLEVNVSLRYDKDTREQTVETPPGFIPAALVGLTNTGDKRKESWDALQPKFSLRWKPQENLTLYGTYSRGFRSGGFNQTGVAQAGVAGVVDTFDEQVADTFEVGFKGQFFDNRLSTNISVFTTDLSGAYYFIFLASSSTQNLGSLDEVTYEGIEFEAIANLAEGLDVNIALALNDSKIKEESDPLLINAIGEKVPLTSDFTFNAGVSFRKPITGIGSLDGVDFLARLDYQIIGKTYWGPGDSDTDFTPVLPWNLSPRDDVDLLDARVGLQGNTWSLMAWSRNLLDEEYNEEFSHPFVWKAQPVKWGIDFMKEF